MGFTSVRFSQMRPREVRSRYKFRMSLGLLTVWTNFAQREDTELCKTQRLDNYFEGNIREHCFANLNHFQMTRTTPNVVPNTKVRICGRLTEN